MKNFLVGLPQSTQSSTPNQVALTPNPKPKVPLLVANSPLREFLPQQLKHPSMQTPDPKGTPFGFTPKTKALYAFGESPGIMLDIINKASKRQIEFEEGQNLGNTIRKQVKTPNPILERIMENVARDSDSSNKTSKFFNSLESLFNIL